jgi:hypothetical protein
MAGGYTNGNASHTVPYGMNTSPSAIYSTGYPAYPSNQGGGNNNGLMAAPYVASHTTSIANPGDPAALEARNCQCGMPCPPRTSNSAANTGRVYFCCPKPREVGNIGV